MDKNIESEIGFKSDSRLGWLRVRYIGQLVGVIAVMNAAFTFAGSTVPASQPIGPICYWVFVVALLIVGSVLVWRIAPETDEVQIDSSLSPLAIATRELKNMKRQRKYRELDNATAVFLIGGISSFAAAYVLIDANAWLVQLFFAGAINAGLVLRTMFHAVLGEMALLDVLRAEKRLELLDAD